MPNLVFGIVAWDDKEQICEGHHGRFIVTQGKLGDTLHTKTQWAQATSLQGGKYERL
jgi:predicted thioesterase